MAADALGTPPSAATPTVGVVSDEDHRLAMAGMIAPQASTLAVRTGAMWGPGSTALVTGTSATGTMTYAIAAHHAVTTRGTADGIYMGPTLDAAITVPTTAAPGANSRIDIIWAKQNDTASTVSADSGSTQPLYGVANGAAAVSPTAPSIPIGAIELARATVAAGATSTNGANVTITNSAAQTVARGASIPVRGPVERDALTAYVGLHVTRLDLAGRIQRWTGSAWDSYVIPTDLPGPWVTVFEGTDTYSQTLTASLVGLTSMNGSVVVPNGRQLEVEAYLPRVEVPAGGAGYFRLIFDAVGKVNATLGAGAGSGGVNLPVTLTATAMGTGAAIAFSTAAYGGGAMPIVKTAGDGSAPGPRIRYRII